MAINPNADLLIENFAKDFQLNFPMAWTKPDQAISFLGFPSTKLYVIPQSVVIDQMGYVQAQTTPKGDDPSFDAIRSEDVLTRLVKQLIDNNGQSKKQRR